MRRKKRTELIILAIIVVVGIGGIVHQRLDKTSTTMVRLGLVGTDSEPVWDNIRKRLKKQGINIEYVVFNDYVQPDVALKEGKTDIHACLTRYYFESYNKEQNAHLTSIAIPNEPTTLGRGLNVLQSAGLIRVKKVELSHL